MKAKTLCRRFVGLSFGFTFVFLEAVFSKGLAHADGLDHWHWRNATPFANTINSLCFGTGKFVAVGDGGVIHTSSDGLTWDDGQRPIDSTLNGVIYANGQFLVVGSSGAILTSPDGFQWTPRSSGTTNDLTAAAFGNGRFVVCGRGGQLVISTNGINWQVSSDGSADLNWITFGNGVFVTSPAGSYVQKVRVSADGVSWVDSAFFPAPMWQMYDAKFGNGIFVLYALRMITGGGIDRFYTSTNGTNWEEGADTVSSPAIMSYGNGLFTLVGSGVSRTPDGFSTDSSAPPADASDSFRCMAFGAGRYILMAGLGQTWSSTTGTNWSALHTGFRASVTQLIRGANYVAVAGGSPLMISSDGMNFVQTDSPAGIFRAAGHDGSNYVAIGVTGNIISGYTGEVYTSSNSVNWIRQTSNANKALVGICRGANRWVAVGAGGTVITSPNTLAWTLRTSGTGNNLNGVAFGNGSYVAVGNTGTVISSPDGATWDVQYSGTTESLNTVQFLNGQFYAVGANGTIVSSLDGSAWNSLSSGTTNTLSSIAYGNGCYLTCGSYYYYRQYQTLLMSTNGLDWQEISQPFSGALRSVAYLDGSFWITGDAGAILRSDSVDGIPRLAGQMLSDGSGFQVRITLNAPSAYCIQCATNLADGTWQDLSVVTNSVSPFIWMDTEANGSPIRLYRTAPWP